MLSILWAEINDNHSLSWGSVYSCSLHQRSCCFSGFKRQSSSYEIHALFCTRYKHMCDSWCYYSFFILSTVSLCPLSTEKSRTHFLNLKWYRANIWARISNSWKQWISWVNVLGSLDLLKKDSFRNLLGIFKEMSHELKTDTNTNKSTLSPFFLF